MERTQVMLACGMVRKEIERVVNLSGYPWPVVWLEKGLHERPELLRAALQEEINKWDGKVDDIILGYALCGMGLIGLKTEKSTLVVPKFDDCIRILLSLKANEEILCDARTLYYTDCWLDSDISSVLSRKRYAEKYGEKKALRILKMMLAGYTSVTLIDTGFYDLDEAAEKLKEDTEVLGLDIHSAPGTIRVYEKFLKGEWDEEFVVVKPGETITDAHFADRMRCVYCREE